MGPNYDLLSARRGAARRGAKHSHYSRYIVTSRQDDSFLGIQFTAPRVNSSGLKRGGSDDDSAARTPRLPAEWARGGGGESLPEEQPLARSCFPFRNRVLSHLPGKAFVLQRRQSARRNLAVPFERSCKHIIGCALALAGIGDAFANRNNAFFL